MLYYLSLHITKCTTAYDYTTRKKKSGVSPNPGFPGGDPGFPGGDPVDHCFSALLGFLSILY